MTPLSRSVVIVSDGRPEALRATIAALALQRGPDFEVCVVLGPSSRHMAEEGWTGAVKLSLCPVANISVARNLGVAAAAGALIAFLDDDALPEPGWLDALARPFEAAPARGGRAPAAVGGLVLLPDGRGVQFSGGLADRTGASAPPREAAGAPDCFALMARFPHVMGANFMTRRAALEAVGGFDEEYEYYLDETDLCCRLIDQGERIAMAREAVVHHLFLAGRVRDGAGVTTDRFPLLKNRVYFALRNGRGHFPLSALLARIGAWAQDFRVAVAADVALDRLAPEAVERFEETLDRALERGLARGLTGERRLAGARLASPPPFKPFPRAAAAATGHIALLASGFGENVEATAAARRRARALARTGAFVRLLTPAAAGRPGAMRFVDGVFEQEVSWRPAPRPNPALARVDEAEWGASLALAGALDEIDARERLDRVEDASGAGLGLATALNGRLRLDVRMRVAPATIDARAPLAATARRAHALRAEPETDIEAAAPEWRRRLRRDDLMG